MQWISAISRADAISTAIDEVVATLLERLQAPPALLFVFATEHFREAYEELPARLRTRFGGAELIGSSASGVICGGDEVEFEPALGVLAAVLPGVEVDAWHIEAGDLAPGSSHSSRLAELAATEPGPAGFLVLADPFTFPTEHLLRSLQQGFPATVIAGGLASGGRAPGEIALLHGVDIHRSGALLVALSGAIELQAVVAQGCRPIGEPMFLTSYDGGSITAIDGHPPLQVLNALYRDASERDRALMKHALFIGIAMRSGASQYAQGDFLIRNLIGADRDSGAIDVAAELHPNQVVQFHLRDAQTSAEDLERVLLRAMQQRNAGPAGALLFSCTGRGEGLYGEPGHDSAVFRSRVGAVPLGGLFCNGEIGPVQGQTFLHGYTSAFALFRPTTDSDG